MSVPDARTWSTTPSNVATPGTPTAPTSCEASSSPVSIVTLSKRAVASVTVDVTRDGKTGRHFWDSLSVFPGDGKGGLSTPTTYALGTLQPEYGWFDPSQPYQANQHQLNTSDLNGDGRTDLIASPGVIALTRPPFPIIRPSPSPGAIARRTTTTPPASFCAARVRTPTCTGSLTPGGTQQARPSPNAAYTHDFQTGGSRHTHPAWKGKTAQTLSVARWIRI